MATWKWFFTAWLSCTHSSHSDASSATTVWRLYTHVTQHNNHFSFVPVQITYYISYGETKQTVGSTSLNPVEKYFYFSLYFRFELHEPDHIFQHYLRISKEHLWNIGVYMISVTNLLNISDLEIGQNQNTSKDIDHSSLVFNFFNSRSFPGLKIL